MKKNEIIIRDPYILLHEGKYYMYGTRSLTTWSKADGFDCYVSDDLHQIPLWDHLKYIVKELLQEAGRALTEQCI